MKCYIVMGVSGYFNDYMWNVKVFGSVDKAQAFTDKLNDIIVEFEEANQNFDDDVFSKNLLARLLPFDHKAHIAESSIHYTCCESEIDCDFDNSDLTYGSNCDKLN